MDESSITQNRRSRRSPVLLTATVYVAGVPIDVKLRNLSEQGALIEGDRLPTESSETVFERKELRLTGRIIWVQGRYAGVAFDVPLKREDVLRHVPAPKRKTNVEPDFRRPGFTCRPLTNYERQNLEAWLATAPRSLGD
jgi:hypothetical protein